MSLPLGYRYAACYAGIRKVEQPDLGLIVSDQPAAVAGVFTQNRVQAAPVKLSRLHLRASRGAIKAVLINAGNANCATPTGDTVARICCETVAKRLKVPVEQVLPASTGVIGVDLNPRLITNAIPDLVRELDPERFDDVANAILTTDTCAKTAAQEVSLRGGAVRVAGMTKGSGMIHPNMATTLGFVMTDAQLSPRELQAILKVAVNRSYNRISVDGDTSTNDTLLLLANGASRVKPNPKERGVIQEIVTWVMEDLAEQIVRDGEGARKLVIIRVLGAADDDSAVRIARAIANSPLVKTAIAGCDPNWGRVLSAAGNSGVPFDPAKVDIHLQKTLVCERGVGADFPEEDLKYKLGDPEVRVRFTIRGRGTGQARFWTCDLTEKYIEINANYRT